MNKPEFEKFTDELFTAFPSLDEWLRQTENPAGTKVVWFKTLSSVGYHEAISVLDRWTSGELKAFQAFERDLVATSIKAIVERDRSKKVPVTKTVEPADYGHRENYVPMSPIFAKAIAMKKEGLSDESIYEFVEQSFPEAPAYTQPRFSCQMCLDRGTIEVWHNTVARAVADKRLSINEATDFYRVACTCSAGERFATSHKYWHAMPRYSPDQYCRFYNGKIEVERERLQRWLNERQPRVNDFEDWN